MCEQFRDRFEQVPCHEPSARQASPVRGPVEFPWIVTLIGADRESALERRRESR